MLGIVLHKFLFRIYDCGFEIVILKSGLLNSELEYMIVDLKF